MVIIHQRHFYLSTSFLVSCVILFLVTNHWHVLALPNGAPEMVCNSMLPSHNEIPPSDSVPPYQIMTSVSALDPTSGEPLFVRIVGKPEGVKFGGFMLQARNRQRPNEVVGQFRPSEDGFSKLINCGGGQENTATHVSPSPKLEMNLEWIPPKDFEGEVVFNATVAQTFHIFWIEISSLPVRIARGVINNSSLNFNPLESFLPQMTTKRVPYEPQFMAATSSPSSIDFYKECSNSKTCFGLESNCIANRDCTAVVSVQLRGSTYEFELHSDKKDADYVAFALSEDNKMGADLATSCSLINGKIELYTYITRGGPDYGANRNGVPQNHAKMIASSYKNGQIYCKFSRDVITSVGNIQFNLNEEEYYLLLASGSNTEENGIAYHDLGREASSHSFHLSEVLNLHPKSRVLVQLHGSFMVVAWIGTTSAGIILARYFRLTWTNKPLWGKDQWFAWHRICMSVTVGLTMLGFVMIFIEINGWSKDGSPHATLGVVTTILCFIQSIGAIFRPPPGGRKRPFFNWGHWFGGNLAHLMAIIGIFFAVKLKKAALPSWTDWILLAYVIFYCIIHIIFSCASCLASRHLAERRNTFQLAEVINNLDQNPTQRMDAPFSGMRKVALLVYLIVLLIIVLSLLVIIFLSPIK